MTSASKKTLEVILNRVSYIYYLAQFRKNKRATIWALINSHSKVNAITPAYTKKLGFQTRKTDVGAQKIDGSSLDTFKMVIPAFQVMDKLSRAWFLQEIFLLADITIEVVLEMPFLTFSNPDIQFVEKGLT